MRIVFSLLFLLPDLRCLPGHRFCPCRLGCWRGGDATAVRRRTGSYRQAARPRWPFLLTSGLAMLPDYILDARTVNFTDLSKPLFARDLLRMIVLVFFLVALTRVHAGMFALYAILLLYFFPWERWRHLVRGIWKRPW